MEQRLGAGFLTWLRERGGGMSPRGFGAPDWFVIGGGETRAGDSPRPATGVIGRDHVKYALVRNDDLEFKLRTSAAD